MGKEKDAEKSWWDHEKGEGPRMGKAGGRGRCPSEVNDLFTNLTLNLPALLEAEYGHLTEKS